MSGPDSNLPDDTRANQGRIAPIGNPLPTLRESYGRLDPYAVAEPPEIGSALSLAREYLRIALKRKWLVASIATAFVALGGLVTLLTTPLYTSTVRLQIESNVAKVVENGNIMPVDNNDSDFLRTQYELLQGREMAERVASSLHLSEDADFVRPKSLSPYAMIRKFLKSGGTSNQTASKAGLESIATNTIMTNRVVRPVAGARLVDISYSDPNPARAQRIAEAYGAAFIAANLDKRFEANSYAKTFLEDQIKQLKLRLEDSEKVLLDFAQKEQIVSEDEKSSIAEGNLAAANATLGALATERIKNEELWKQVEHADAINMPQILTSTAIEALRGQRNALSTEYQEKSQIYKADYPDMVQISKKLKEIDRQLAAEVATIKDSLKATYESSLNQENETAARIETLRNEVLDLQKRSIQYNILKREVDTNRDLYNNLLQRYKEVDIAGGVGSNNVFVAEKADMPAAPSSPQLGRALLLSLAIGLGLSLAAAFALERLDDTIKTPEEGERVSGLATLGIIPKTAPGKTPEAELADPRSGVAEAYRSLCTALQFSTDTGLPKSLLVTSASPSEGKSMTALAVGRHFANLGMKVLLIDADLRKPSLHNKLGLENSVGLSNYLTGNSMPPEVIQRTATQNLAFMASGPLPPNAADLLGSARLQSLLTLGLEVFDLIVIDGPPVMGLADSLILSSAASAAMFVVGAGDTRGGTVRSAIKRLHFGRAPLIGSVLTKYDARAEGYGGRYGAAYGYGYTYGYGHDAATGAAVATTSEPAPGLKSARRAANG